MIEIKYPTEKYFPSFYETLSSVAKELVYIEMTEPPPFEKVASFQRSLISKNGPVFYAVEDGRVVGWCDIFPEENPRLAHRGSLGMGVLKDFRHRGIGSQLISATLSRAQSFGLEKVELHVYTSNPAAISLYEKFGFEREGLIKRYRKLGDQTFDCLAMAKFLTNRTPRT